MLLNSIWNHINDFLSNVISKPCLFTKLLALSELWRVSSPLNIIHEKYNFSCNY